MAEPLTPTIIVLALGAGALGFPDALRLLLRDVAGRRRSPVLDIAVCAVAMLVLTAYALGAVLLARFVRKAGAGAGAGGAPRARLTDPFARLTLAMSLGAAGLVFACLIAEPGARGLALLRRRIVGDIAGEIPVVWALAAVVLACTARWRPLRLRGAAPASSPAARLPITITAQSAASAAFLLVCVSVAVAVGACMVLSRFTRNAADAGGRAALGPATDTRRFEY